MGVRREEVRIHATSNLATVAARDAASVRLLAKNADGLSDSAVRSHRDTRRMSKGLGEIDRSARRSDASINALTGRLRLFADVAAILGPALVPLGAVGIPAVSGLASQLGFAAVAGGTALIAFQGVGDAVSAMNEYALEPTTENLAKAEAELGRLSPAAAQFARQVGSMRDEWLGLRDAAATGLFPELTEALGEADVVFDRAERVLGAVGEATGSMLADGIDSLGTDRWAEFTSFLESEARPVMADLGAITGSFTHGLTELWMATQPLNRDFSSWLVDAADGFDQWAAGLDQTEGFANFMDYVRDNGPQVAQTASALGTAVVDLTTAIAPLGGPSLQILEAIAKVFSAIADSPLGTPLLTAAAGLAALNRGLAVGSKLSAFDLRTTALGKTLTGTRSAASSLAGDLGAVGIATRKSAADVERARSRLSGYAATAGKAGLAAGGLALATTDLGVGLLGSSTASGALMGSIGGLRGTIAGAAIGAVLDLRAANADLEQSFNNLDAAASGGDFAGEVDSYSAAAAKLREEGELLDKFYGSIGEQTDLLFSGDLIAASQAALSDFLGYGVSEARDDLAGYNQQMQALGNTGNLGTVLSRPFDIASRSISNASGSVTDFITATSRLEGILAREGALVNYRASMDALDDSLRANGGSFDTMTTAGQANTNQLLAAGQAAIDYAKNLRGADRTRFLENTQRRLREVAGEFPQAGRLVREITRELRKASGQPFKVAYDPSGLRIAESQATRLRRTYDEFPEALRTRIETTGIPQSQTEVRALGRAYDLTPREVRTLMTLQAAAAKTGIRDVNSLLTATDRRVADPTITVTDRASGPIAGVRIGLAGLRDKSVTVTTTLRTVYETVRSPSRMGGGPAPVPGMPSLATGGAVRGPGSETSDSIPAMLSNNEFVMRAAAVRKYGLEQMHAMNALRLAEGGSVRQQAERQGVAAAMRAGGGRMQVEVRSRVGGVLDLPDGRQVLLEEFESLVDQRIEDYAAADADWGKGEASRTF